VWKRESKRARQRGSKAEREEGTEGTYKKRVRTSEINGKDAVFVFYCRCVHFFFGSERV